MQPHVGNEAVSWRRQVLSSKSTWPALSGAPVAFVGYFGLRVSKIGKDGVGQLGDWSVHAISILLRCSGVCRRNGYIGVLVIEIG